MQRSLQAWVACCPHHQHKLRLQSQRLQSQRVLSIWCIWLPHEAADTANSQRSTSKSQHVDLTICVEARQALHVSSIHPHDTKSLQAFSVSGHRASVWKWLCLCSSNCSGSGCWRGYWAKSCSSNLSGNTEHVPVFSLLKAL